MIKLDAEGIKTILESLDVEISEKDCENPCSVIAVLVNKVSSLQKELSNFKQLSSEKNIQLQGENNAQEESREEKEKDTCAYYPRNIRVSWCD